MILPSEALNRIGKRVYYNVEADHAEYDSRCGFKLSEYGFLLKKRESAEVIKGQEICQIPGAPEWFLGIANQRGILFPVFDLFDYFNIKDEEGKSWILYFGEGSKAVGIKIYQLPVIVKINEKYENVEKIPEFLLPYAPDGYIYNNTIWYDISFDQLFLSLHESFK